MMTSGLVLTMTLAAGGAYAADKIPDNIAAAVTDPGRPANDTARDADRKPGESLTFAGVKTGGNVVDFVPGGGYFTRILSKAVGPKGHVTALSLPGSPDKYVAPSQAIAADPAYSNVTAAVQNVGDLPAGSVDLFWTAQNYHDLHNVTDADVAALDKAIFVALKPGGTFLVIDHADAAGTGFKDTNTLHRIDVEAVKKEVENAGFVLAAQSDLLKNPTDPHTVVVFDPSIRGKTDQFMLKFEKPKK
ncbi:MAG: methyltransferase [Rhodospirillales bacterium]|nr:methyltransferase [Rhodospirillales bacterium]